MKPTFYEFFAGGGMARAGLEPNWRCLFANDIDAKKRDAYIANWGEREFRLGDIHALSPKDLPGHADLAWASFPCQDLSLAGNGKGLDGERSGAFWGFHGLVHSLRLRGRSPKMLVLENVGGALTSKDGRDFTSLCRALKSLGYVYGALMIDAAHFLPQSRPRLFIVAVHARLERNIEPLASSEASPHWTTATLDRCYAQLRPDLRSSWRWWRLPAPPKRNAVLADMIEDDPSDVRWHPPAGTRRLLSMMSDVNREKVRSAMTASRRVIGTVYKRTRRDESGAKIQRAEARFDGIAGCLRTPGGGSSRQTVLVIEGRSVRSRLLSAREAARLMGLRDTYILPSRYNDAYHMLGDGLAVPVVKFLSENLLTPLLYGRSGPILIAAE